MLLRQQLPLPLLPLLPLLLFLPPFLLLLPPPFPLPPLPLPPPRCEIPGLNFFGTKMIPVVYIKVEVDKVNGRAYLIVQKIELTGSRIAEIANGTFDGELW